MRHSNALIRRPFLQAVCAGMIRVCQWEHVSPVHLVWSDPSPPPQMPSKPQEINAVSTCKPPPTLNPHPPIVIFYFYVTTPIPQAATRTLVTALVVCMCRWAAVKCS